MVIRLVGAARLVDGHVRRARPGRRSSTSSIRSRRSNGAFNAVMLQGDAIREITLEGPGAGGIETASAVIADMASVIGTMGTGFLQNDAAWRELPELPVGDSTLAVLLPPLGRGPPRRARARRRGARASARSRSRACCSTRTGRARRCTSSRTRRASVRSAKRSPRSSALPEVHAASQPLPVVSDRGVTELGWA